MRKLSPSRFPSVRQMIVESALRAMNEEDGIEVGTNRFPASRLMSDEDINAQHHNWWFSEIEKKTSRGFRGSPRVDVVAAIEFPDADGETFDESRTLWFVGDEDGDYEDFRDQNDVWLSPDIRGEVLAVLNYVRYNWSNGESKMFNTPEEFEAWKQSILSAEDEEEQDDGGEATYEFTVWLSKKEPRLLSTNGRIQLERKLGGGGAVSDLWDKLADEYEKETGKPATK